jgi:capsular polysaccharide biosynthesis protein
MKAPRAVLEGLLAAVVVGAAVLLAVALRDGVTEGRLTLLATPSASDSAQFGEVTSLATPAVVQLVRSPSVLDVAAAAGGMTPDRLSDAIAVELVPASGVARISVRADSAAHASAAVTAVAQAVIEADLLAPAAKFRLLDPRPETTQVTPDWRLATGLALVAAVIAGVAFVALRRLRGNTVRVALAGAGITHPVVVTTGDDPELADRLTALCVAAARPVRVLAVSPSLVERAEALARALPDKASEPADGTAVIAVASNDRARRHDLATALAVLPASSVLVAVVLA